MPRARAAARASSIAPMPQHPEPSAVRGTQVGQRFMVIPTTSCPSPTSSAAATALSTPPLIATATRAIDPLILPLRGVGLHARPPGPEPLANAAFLPRFGGFVVQAIPDVVRQILLRDEPARRVVRVLIPGTVAQPGRPRVVRVPQMPGHRMRLRVFHVVPRPRD